MHEHLKKATGIATANCETCAYLTTDGDGNYPEKEITWLICGKIPRMGNLKSFPFKKEMECWHPEFWQSKFAGMIKTGTDEEVRRVSNAFANAISDLGVEKK